MENTKPHNMISLSIDMAAQALGYESIKKNVMNPLASLNNSQQNKQGDYLNYNELRKDTTSDPLRIPSLSTITNQSEYLIQKEPQRNQEAFLTKNNINQLVLSEEFIESNRKEIIRNYLQMSKQEKQMKILSLNNSSQNIFENSYEDSSKNFNKKYGKFPSNEFKQNGINYSSQDLQSNNNFKQNVINFTSQDVQSNKNFSNNFSSLQNIPTPFQDQQNLLNNQNPNCIQNLLTSSSNLASYPLSTNYFKLSQQMSSQTQQFENATQQQKQQQYVLIEREFAYLQKRLQEVSTSISQISQSQTDLLGISNFSRNRKVIEFLQEQLNESWREKNEILSRLVTLTSEKERQSFQQIQDQFQHQSQVQQQKFQIQLRYLQHQQKKQLQEREQSQLIFQKSSTLSVGSKLKFKSTNDLETLNDIKINSMTQQEQQVNTSESDKQSIIDTDSSQNKDEEEKNTEIIEQQTNSCSASIQFSVSEPKPSFQNPKKFQDIQIEKEEEQINLPQILPSKIEEGIEEQLTNQSQIIQIDTKEINKLEQNKEDDIDAQESNSMSIIEENNDIQVEDEELKRTESNDKKADKRFEKIYERIEDILQKEQKACQKIKPIALELCLKISKMSEVLKNKPYEAIAAAIIVHASRVVCSPITVKNMAKITQSKEKMINKVFMYLKQNVEGFHNKMPSPQIFISNICKKMEYCQSIFETSLHLYHKSQEFGLVKAQHAATVAACIVKLAAFLHGKDMTVKQICEASNVCQISLRLLYRQIFPNRSQLLGDYKMPNIEIPSEIQSENQ